MIKLIKSTFYNEGQTKKQLCSFIKQAQMLSFGSECKRFERRFAGWQGRNHCVFVNSGSSANLAVIQALLNMGKIKRGDAVGFSSLTWSTNAMPLIQLGLSPVPIDVEMDTLNVSSRTLTKVLGQQPLKMVFLTNLLGFCDDIDEIVRISKKTGMILIEDSCESLGTVYKGKKLGNWGLASTFSFYVGHHMSTVEGGAVATDNERLATMLAIVRAHGWDRNLSWENKMQYRSKHHVNRSFYSRYTFYDLGYNFRPTEINGCIGNIQISYLDEIISKRQENFLTISQALSARKDLYYPLRYNHLSTVSNFAYPVVCRSKEIRNNLVESCKNIIEIRPIVGGDMTAQPFFSKYIKRVGKSPNARIIHEQGLYFGNNPELTKKEIGTIIDIFTR